MAGGVSEVRGKSSDNPTSLLGEALDFLVIDEAARLPAKVWEGHLVQRLLDRNGKALLISTPFGKNWLFDLYRRGQGDDPDYASWQFPSAANPYLDAKMIEKERERLPERVWNQEYLARWVEGQGSVFMRVREAAVGDWADPIPGEEYVKTIKAMQAYQQGTDGVTVKYNVRIDKDAVKGSNEIKLKINEVGSEISVTETFNMDITGAEYAQII